MSSDALRLRLSGAELERLAALHGLAILDQPRNLDLDGMARLTSYVCGTPVAVVNVMDADRQWQAAAYGTEPIQVTRSQSMCARSFESTDVTYVPDATMDERFADNPHVTGELENIRLYVAAPLVLSSGHSIGTLCAYGPEPAELTGLQIDRLRDLAAMTVRMLELRKAAGALALAAARDPLTGLPNRTMFEDALHRAFERRLRGGTAPGVLFLDLNGFKSVNDRFGHAAGDAVLRIVTERLLDSVRATDVLSRYGGDEFVVLVEDATAESLDLLAHRLHQALSQPVEVAGEQVGVVSASIGMAVPEGAQDTPAALLARADAEMYQRKPAADQGA